MKLTPVVNFTILHTTFLPVAIHQQNINKVNKSLAEHFRTKKSASDDEIDTYSQFHPHFKSSF